MKKFLDRVIDHMLSNGIPLEEQALVLPSRRSITFFKQRLSQRSDIPVFLPHILTLDDLARKVTAVELLDPVSSGLELYAVYHSLYPDYEDYEVFESWIGAILKDFNTIDTYLIDADTLYRDLRNLKEINDWSYLEEELGHQQKNFNEFWQRLGPLYREYGNRLKEIGKAYSGAIIRRCAVEIASSQYLKSFKQLNVAGFNALSPAEGAILDVLHDQDRLMVFWDDAPFYTENNTDPAGLFMRRWKQRNWSQSFGSEKESLSEITISGHPHAISQVTWAGSLLSEVKEEEEVALVLADESLLRPLLDYFPKNLEKVNITIGMSFKDTSVFQFLAGYFRMIIQANQGLASRGDWGLHHREWRNWIEAAVNFGLLRERVIQSVDKLIYKQRQIYFNAEAVQDLVGKDIAIRYGLLATDSHGYLDAMVNCLRDVESGDHIIQGVSKRLIEILEDTGATVTSYEFINGVDILWRCLKGSLSRERISFVGEPLEGLQVMGLLETRTLDFDRVIMLGANEGALPKGKSYDTFLPFDLRKHYKLPTQQEEDAIFAYYFYRCIQKAKRVDIAYTSERDELGGGEQSRYLTQLMSSLPQEHGFKADVEHVQYAVQNADVPHVYVEVPKDEEVRAKVLEYFERGISFSRLSEYSRCPLDFYYRTVLRLGEQAEVEEELGSSDLGDVVHEVLDRSFKPFKGKGILTELEIFSMQKRSQKLLEEVLEEKGLKDKVLDGESALVKSVAEHMLSNYWKRETARVAGKNIQILHLEEDWEFSDELDIAGTKVNVRFKAKLDRVERNGDLVHLIDYKTGKVDTKDVSLTELTTEKLFDVKKLKALQLMYYTWFYWRMTGDIAQSGIVSLIGMEEDPISLIAEKQELPEVEQLQEFEVLLIERLLEIANEGRFIHDEKNGLYCSHCIERAEKKF